VIANHGNYDETRVFFVFVMNAPFVIEADFLCAFDDKSGFSF
jgi:hypothetical protein